MPVSVGSVRAPSQVMSASQESRSSNIRAVSCASLHAPSSLARASGSCRLVSRNARACAAIVATACGVSRGACPPRAVRIRPSVILHCVCRVACERAASSPAASGVSRSRMHRCGPRRGLPPPLPRPMPGCLARVMVCPLCRIRILKALPQNIISAGHSGRPRKGPNLRFKAIGPDWAGS